MNQDQKGSLELVSYVTLLKQKLVWVHVRACLHVCVLFFHV